MPLHDYPKYDALQQLASDVPNVDQDAVASFMALIKVSGQAINALESHFAAHNLSQGRFFVLMFLYIAGDEGLSATKIAEKALVTRATMTGLIDSLEREELVKRHPHPTDRRTNVVRITKKGHDLMDTILPDHYGKLMDYMSELEKDEKQQLVDLLRKVMYGLPEFADKKASAS